MKNLTLIIIILLGACSYEKNQKNSEEMNEISYPQINNNEEINEVSYPRIPYEDSIKSLITKNDLLLSFDTDYPLWNEVEYDKISSQMPKNDKASVPTVYIKNDSIFVQFYKIQNNPAECHFFGNISIEHDTIKLLFDNICDPKQELLTEEGLVRFKYILAKNIDTADYVFKPVETNPF